MGFLAQGFFEALYSAFWPGNSVFHDCFILCLNKQPCVTCFLQRGWKRGEVWGKWCKRKWWKNIVFHRPPPQDFPGGVVDWKMTWISSFCVLYCTAWFQCIRLQFRRYNPPPRNLSNSLHKFGVSADPSKGLLTFGCCFNLGFTLRVEGLLIFRLNGQQKNASVCSIKERRRFSEWKCMR